MLRYKGKPHKGSNRQVDRLPELCFCRFTAVGYPLNDTECDVHTGPYSCDECPCINYRPNKVKRAPAHWPLCSCGHMAQEHNRRTL